MSESIAATLLLDHAGRQIRPTAERRAHILEHPEMVAQLDRLVAPASRPALIVYRGACLSSLLSDDPSD